MKEVKNSKSAVLLHKLLLSTMRRGAFAKGEGRLGTPYNGPEHWLLLVPLALLLLYDQESTGPEALVVIG